MILNTSSVAVTVLLPLILALSFECLLCNPTPNLNQQVINRVHMAPIPQYRESPQPPAPPQLQQQQRPSISRVLTPQANPSLGNTADNLMRQPTPGSVSRSIDEFKQAQLRPGRLLSDDNKSDRQRSGQFERVSLADQPFSVNEQGVRSNSKVDRDLRNHGDQLDFAQRVISKLNSNDVRSMSLDGVNINNHQTTIKLGNNKSVNINSFKHMDVADNRRTKVDDVNMDTSGQNGSSAGILNQKEKATPEQKELKRKLIELADIATSTPPDVMRFNQETQSFEPLNQDPSLSVYRKKLLDAMRALSSKRLPAERLRKALEDDYQDSERERVRVSDFSSESVSESNSNSHSELNESGSVSFSPDYMDRSSTYDESKWSNRASGSENELSDEELYEQSQEGYYRGANEPDEGFYEHSTQEQEFDQQSAGAPEESLASSYGYHAGSGYQDSMADVPNSRYVNREIETEGSREHVDGAASESTAEYVDVGDRVKVDETLDEVRNILDDRLSRLSDLLYFRPEILNQLLRMDDNQLTSIEREFKRMVLCNSDERFCNRDLNHCPVSLNEFSTVSPVEKLVSSHQPYHYDQDVTKDSEEKLIYESTPIENAAEYNEDSREALARAAADEERRNLLGRAARNLEEQSFEERQINYDDLHEGRSRADALPFFQPQTYMASSKRSHLPSYRRSQSEAYYAYQKAHGIQEPTPQPARNVPEPEPKVRSTWAQAELVNGMPRVEASRVANQYSPRYNDDRQHHHQTDKNLRESQGYITANPSRINQLAAGPQQPILPIQQNPSLDNGHGNKVQTQPRPVLDRAGAPVQPVYSLGQQAQARPQPSRPNPHPQQQQQQRGPQQMTSAGQQPVRNQPLQGPPHPLGVGRNNLQLPVDVYRAQSPPVAVVQAKPNPVEPPAYPIGGPPHQVSRPYEARPSDASEQPRPTGLTSVNASKRN